MVDEPHDIIELLLPAYALNALEPDERAMVEQALDDDPRYRAMLDGYLEGTSALADSFPPADPSSALKPRVLDAIGPVTAGGSPPVRGGGVPPTFWGMAAVLVIAVLGLSGFVVVQQQQVRELEDEMEMLVAEAQKTDDMLKDQLELTALAVQPGVSRASLTAVATPAPVQGPAQGTVFTRPDGARVLWAVNLEPLAEGHTYQAWLWDPSGRAYSVATFEVDENGHALIPMWVPSEMSGGKRISISVEPEGGAIIPAGKNILAGQFD